MSSVVLGTGGLFNECQQGISAMDSPKQDGAQKVQTNLTFNYG